MTNYPIERAARALCENPSEDPDEIIEMSDGSFAPRWKAEVWRVHAVLRAIREPSEAMIDEAYDSYNANGGSLRDVFMDMIDIALEVDAKP